MPDAALHFHAVYAFIQAAGTDGIRIWPSVRDEFKHFRGLLPLCESHWIRQWSAYVTQTDASEAGFGIVTSMWPRRVVSACRRASERSRFKRLPGAIARSRALEGAGFEHVDGR